MSKAAQVVRNDTGQVFVAWEDKKNITDFIGESLYTSDIGKDVVEALRGMLAIHDSVTLGQQRELVEKWVPLARKALADIETN
jgi:hypothetical protein